MDSPTNPPQKQMNKKVIGLVVAILAVLLMTRGALFMYLQNTQKPAKPTDFKPVSAQVGTTIEVSIENDGASQYFRHNGERLSLTNRITDVVVGTEYTLNLTNRSGSRQGMYIPIIKEVLMVDDGQTQSMQVRFDTTGTHYITGLLKQPGWEGLRTGFDVVYEATTNTCQCDLGVVMENNCVAPAVPVCQSQMVCVCNAFTGSEPTATITITPTVTVTPTPTTTRTPTPTPTSGAGGTFTSCADVTEIPQAECQALVDLYNSTNGPGWTNAAGWLQTNTPCSWDRLTCNGPRISELHLSSNRLQGTIPESIGNLNLNGLYMSNNSISGSIPSSIGNMTNLRNLFINDNQLTGPIPISIENLGLLDFLQLKNNRLNGTIPNALGNLTTLQNLGLDNNQFSGNIPGALGQLTRLNSLHLANNQLTGTVPASLANLSAISGMNVSLRINSLTGVENQTVCPWLAAHSASNWWQMQTPPIATDPCASGGNVIEEAQPVSARTTDIGKPTTMPAANPNIFGRIARFFQELLNAIFGRK
ncbi:MAG TPA: hypothetical protein PKG71_03025 [Candidatus Woesebacteria bacterium]|nr:hypothetical protein [Candidatus Woesebacteria bacterium]HNS94915.1 hypothetical protein [Candidatus Woesebacteria bacterium]